MDGIPCPASKPAKNMDEKMEKAKEKAKETGQLVGAKIVVGAGATKDGLMKAGSWIGEKGGTGIEKIKEAQIGAKLSNKIGNMFKKKNEGEA